MIAPAEVTFRTLADIACCFVPSNRPPHAAEMAALERFLDALGAPRESTAALLKAGLAGKRPPATLNAQLAALCARLSGDDRRELMRHVYRLLFAIDGHNVRLAHFAHFVGAFLGVRDADQAALRAAAAAELTPRTPEGT